MQMAKVCQSFKWKAAFKMPTEKKERERERHKQNSKFLCSGFVHCFASSQASFSLFTYFHAPATFCVQQAHTSISFFCCDCEQIRLIYCKTFRFPFDGEMFNFSYERRARARKPCTIYPWTEEWMEERSMFHCANEMKRDSLCSTHAQCSCSVPKSLIRIFQMFRECCNRCTHIASENLMKWKKRPTDRAEFTQWNK